MSFVIPKRLVIQMGEDGLSKNVTVSSCPVLNLQILHENDKSYNIEQQPFRIWT